MVSISGSNVADALHLSGTSELPDGYKADISAAETIVGTQVEPYVDGGEQGMVKQCAVFVAAAFISGTEDDQPIKQMQRESQSLTFDTNAASDEAADMWSRAQAFDPTGRLGQNTTPDAQFRVF
jgi:hypothetical protein